MSADGCLIDAPLILTAEEYNSKVLFDKEGLLQVQDLSPSLLHELILHDEDEDNNISSSRPLIAFNFGDLLTHVPLVERAKWKEFYRGMKTDASFSDNHLDKLL